MGLNIILGITGIATLLVAFLLLEFNKLKPHNKSYNFLNFFGSVMLATYAITLKDPVFSTFNIIWATLAIYLMYKYN